MRSTVARWARRSLVIVAAVALPLSAQGARVIGKVTGYLELRNPVWMEAKDPLEHGFSFREPVPTVDAKYRNLFPHLPKEICVALLAEGAQSPQHPILVRVGGGRTTPVTLVVTPGTKLEFENTDPFAHSLYVVGLKTFPPGVTKRGDSREWTVPGPGVFEVRDELAPSLRMWVVGEPKVKAVSFPSMKGEFALSVDEPGQYRIQPFFSGKPIGKSLSVEFKGADIDLRRAPFKLEAKTAATKKGDE